MEFREFLNNEFLECLYKEFPKLKEVATLDNLKNYLDAHYGMRVVFPIYIDMSAENSVGSFLARYSQNWEMLFKIDKMDYVLGNDLSKKRVSESEREDVRKNESLGGNKDVAFNAEPHDVAESKNVNDETIISKTKNSESVTGASLSGAYNQLTITEKHNIISTVGNNLKYFFTMAIY